MALDARNGDVLWKALTSGQISSAPISYSSGRQAVRGNFCVPRRVRVRIEIAEKNARVSFTENVKLTRAVFVVRTLGRRPRAAGPPRPSC